MRYLTIQYVRKPNGQMDESIAVCKRLRDCDIQMNSVVVDFRDRRVIKASMGNASEVKPLMWVVSALFVLYFAIHPVKELLGL